MEYGADMINKLKEDIKNSVWVEPLENSAYRYGVNLKTFRDLMDYWRTEFDFEKSLSGINAFQHYRTEIEGIPIGDQLYSCSSLELGSSGSQNRQNRQA